MAVRSWFPYEDASRDAATRPRMGLVVGFGVVGERRLWSKSYGFKG
jgi:hypothetical protein